MASLTEHNGPNSCDYRTDSGQPRGNLQTPRSQEAQTPTKEDTKKGRTKPQAEHTGEKKQRGEKQTKKQQKKPVRSVTTLNTRGTSFSQPATLSLSQGTSNTQPEKECSVSSQVAITCGSNVLHVQSNDLETMTSFTLSVHSSSTRMQAYLGCWSVCSDNTRPGAHKSIKMEKGRHSLPCPNDYSGSSIWSASSQSGSLSNAGHTTCSGSLPITTWRMVRPGAQGYCVRP